MEGNTNLPLVIRCKVVRGGGKYWVAGRCGAGGGQCCLLVGGGAGPYAISICWLSWTTGGHILIQATKAGGGAAGSGGSNTGSGGGGSGGW